MSAEFLVEMICCVQLKLISVMPLIISADIQWYSCRLLMCYFTGVMPTCQPPVSKQWRQQFHFKLYWQNPGKM